MYKLVGKRFFDILFSLLALPFVFVVIIVFAPIIYLEDKGPVFYCAERIGKKGKLFKMYKLRSMKVNSPDIRNIDGSTFNGDDDPRLTSVGKIIRKMSIDEFPQFINVLQGHMSIIGPRPNLPSEYDKLPYIEKKRLEVKPGITGYNQAYYRNSVDSEEKFIHDVYYVDNLSFLLDIKIFLQTIISVLLKKNININ